MGAAAAAANCSTLLRTAPISDTSEMNSRYGNVIRVNSTARSYFIGSSEKPGAKISMKDGMISSNTTSSTSWMTSRNARTCSAKIRACDLPCPTRNAENIGTKAALNAPSANSARKWLGSRNATKKASATGPAPSNAAVRISRTKPRTRLARVRPPTERILRNTVG